MKFIEFLQFHLQIQHLCFPMSSAGRDPTKAARFQIYRLIQSINQIFQSENRQLPYSKDKIYEKALELFGIRNTVEIQDHSDIFQKSFDEVVDIQHDEMKDECFANDFEMDEYISQSMRQNTQNSFQEGQMVIVSPLTGRSDIYIRKTSHENQITKYNRGQADIFEAMINQVKLVEEVRQKDSLSEVGLKIQYQYNKINNSQKIEQNISSVKIEEPQQEQAQSFEEQKEDQDSQYSVSQAEYKQYSSVLKQSLKKSFAKKPRTIKVRKYRSYSEKQRMEAIQLAYQNGIQFASKYLNIPKKNITRWMTTQRKPKQIRGRRPGDPQMEIALKKWIKQYILNGIYLTQTQIRVKALQLSTDPSFKASKGWLQKFFKRNQDISSGVANLFNLKRIQSEVGVSRKTQGDENCNDVNISKSYRYKAILNQINKN